MAGRDLLTADGTARDRASAAPEDPTPACAGLTRALGYSRYLVLLVVVAVMFAVTAICVIAPIYTVASIWMVLRDAMSGDLVAHSGILRILELVILGLEAVAFYLVGIGLYHLFISPLPLAHRVGLDSLDKLEARLVSVVIAMTAVAFVGHLVLGEHPTDVLIYAVAVALVVPALTWFKRQLD
ncbi:MAG TPA: YqhA family protein [Chloroflexota bacterium]|jgi:uncharacterized membrane protein YqhA